MNRFKKQLSDELGELAQKQQDLSASDADWRKRIRKKISEVNMEITGKISAYQINAANLLDQELLNPSNRKLPELVLNQVVSFTAMQATDIKDYIEEELKMIYVMFDEEMEMNITESLISPPVSVDENPNIIFEKMSAMDKAVYVGRVGSGEGYGLRSVGGIAGGLLGGIGGFLLGGPLGAVAGFTMGYAAGSSVGGAVGTARGTYKAIKNGSVNNTPQIRSEIMKYITQTAAQWKVSLPKYMTETAYTLEDNLELAIKNRMVDFKNSRRALENAARLTVEERQAEQKRLAEIRKEGMGLMKKIGALANEMMKTQESLKAGPNIDKGETKAADIDYSELDD